MQVKWPTFALCVLLSVNAFAMNAKHAHGLIQQQAPSLLGNGSQLVSVYYFGQSMDMTVVGLERVGENFLPIRWLVIIQHESLLGWYYPSDEFPVRLEAGQLIFPKGTGIDDVNLLPNPPSHIVSQDHLIPFYPLSP